jgi:hypothetical protein
MPAPTPGTLEPRNNDQRGVVRTGLAARHGAWPWHGRPPA